MFRSLFSKLAVFLLLAGVVSAQQTLTGGGRGNVLARICVPNTISGPNVLCTAQDAAHVVLRLKAASAPSTSIFQIVDSSDVVQVYISQSWRLFMGGGSASAPSFSFAADVDIGMYRIAANNLGWAIGANKFFELGGSQTALFQDTTATTGDTTLVVKEGAAISNNLFELQENSGALGWVFSSPRSLSMGRDGVHSIKAFGGNAADSIQFLPISFFTRSSGNVFHVNFTSTFSPTSGTATFTDFQLAPTINQTGGANGITRGLYINPTLTAVADFRAIEVADVGATEYALKTGTGAVDLGDKLSAKPGGTVPACEKYTKTAADLTTASGTEDEVLFNLPANGVLTGVRVKHSVAFADGGLTAMTVSVRESSGTIEFASAFDIFQAVNSTTAIQYTDMFKAATSSADDVIARFTATNETMDNVGTGSVDIHVCWVVLL